MAAVTGALAGGGGVAAGEPNSAATAPVALPIAIAKAVERALTPRALVVRATRRRAAGDP